MIWSDDQVDFARRRWVAGWSAGQIAKAMQADGIDVSRCAVIGKVHRLGLCRGGQSGPTAPGTVRIAPPPRLAYEVHREAVAAVIAARPDQCRWPLWDDSNPGGYCECTAEHGSYCADHAAMVFRA